MKCKLTVKQRDFLVYVKDNHHSLGWGYTIRSILNKGQYDAYGEEAEILEVVNDFRKLLKGQGEMKYGKPTKYLKG